MGRENIRDKGEKRSNRTIEKGLKGKIHFYERGECMEPSVIFVRKEKRTT